MSTVITEQQVIESAERVVSQVSPEHVNKGCIYISSDWTPQCIAANIVADLGLEWERLGDQEGESIGSALEHVFPARFEQKAISFLNALQAKADYEVPWVEVLHEAKALVPTLHV